MSQVRLIYTALNVRHHRGEMARQLADAEVSVLFAGPGFEALATGLAENAGAKLVGIAGAALTENYETLLASAASGECHSHDDVDAPYALTYTSGTTGEPKGAVITSRNELFYIQSLAWVSRSLPDDRHLVALPLFHRGGQFATMHPAFYGLPTIIVPRPDPVLLFETIQTEQVTSLLLVPTVMAMMVNKLQDLGLDRYDLSSLRVVTYGSNPTGEDTLRAFAKLFRCGLAQIGGMGTEGGVGLSLSPDEHLACLNDPALAHRLASSGTVQPGVELRLVDEHDNDVAVGKPGEMVFRADSFVSGYWRRPEASAEAWCNGWFHSGDIGTMDADGYVYYVDRKAGRIKTGAETVYAREVEQVLRTHPSVTEVAVAGVPDAKWGEAIFAAVEVAEPLSEDELRDFARRHLARFKVPKRIFFVDALPRTAIGKVALGQVKQLLVDHASPLRRTDH